MMTAILAKVFYCFVVLWSLAVHVSAIITFITLYAEPCCCLLLPETEIFGQEGQYASAAM